MPSSADKEATFRLRQWKEKGTLLSLVFSTAALRFQGDGVRVGERSDSEAVEVEGSSFSLVFRISSKDSGCTLAPDKGPNGRLVVRAKFADGSWLALSE